MSFKHSCFISYRHGQRELTERIITDLSSALANELELLRDEGVFVDRDRLNGGMFYNEALAKALCESACMVMVFTPTYFNMAHTYCAREYKAMEELEEQRLSALGHSADTHGLIIPVIFRGWEALPEEIKSRRQCYPFDKFSLCDRRMTRHPEYAPKIKEMAGYIHERCGELASLGTDPFACCDGFALPHETKIKPWLEGVVRPMPPLPLRKKGK